MEGSWHGKPGNDLSSVELFASSVISLSTNRNVRLSHYSAGNAKNQNHCHHGSGRCEL